MSASDLLSRRPSRANRLALRREGETPMLAIQNEMNRMFDQFFTDDFPFSTRLVARPAQDFLPKLDISETETEYKVTAELPGMEEKDIQIRLEKDTLVLSGEKKTETEEKEKTYHRVERSYGSFERVIPFDTQLDEDKVSAVFKNGVLTITLPKAGDAIRKSRQIEIKKG
mgnify:CR=1 FL=1